MQAALIVCERTGSWCVNLRQLLSDCPLEIVETRSLIECREALCDRPDSLVVIEAKAETLPNLLGWLARLDSDFPRVAAAVVADRSLAEYQWPVREAGALAFVTSPRELGPLAAAARLFFASRGPTRMNTTERVWNSLPWKSAARPAAGRAIGPQ